MVTRNGHAVWQGGLKRGKGTMDVGSGELDSSFTAGSRFETAKGTNPEELIGAAHAGCYSMALSHALEEAGHKPEMVDTTAAVKLETVDGGAHISDIFLRTEAEVPGIDDTEFQRFAGAARDNCPVSKALGGIAIHLEAKLKE